MHQLLRRDDGQDSTEYGLLIAAVGLLILGTTGSFGARVFEWLAAIATRITASATL